MKRKLKLRWYWQVLLGIALPLAAIAIFDSSKIGLEVKADKPAIAFAPEPYRVVKAKKTFVGWHKATLEIEADTATTQRQQIETMMQAAIDQFRKHNVDVMSVRLWQNYESATSATNRLVYAPDGCGWLRGSGKTCDKPIWTDLLRGELPPDLLDWNG